MTVVVLAGDGSADSDETGSGEKGDQDGGQAEVPTAEKVVMVVSALFTVAVFAFAAWQGVTGPAATHPTASIANETTTADGAVLYEVQLRNPTDTGFVSVTVVVSCGDPPPQITFENVPAQGTRTGTVSCPTASEDPAVDVLSWVSR